MHNQMNWHRLFSFIILLAGLSVSIAAQGSRPAELTPIQREIERQRQRLESTEVEERRDALMRLGNLKRRDAAKVAAKALSDPIPIVRATAVHAIIYLPTGEAVELLIPLLKDKKEFVRQETAYALGETRSAAAVASLADALLSDKQNSVRGAAAVSLGQIGDQAAAMPLAEILAGPGWNDSAAKKKKSKVTNELVLRAAAHSLGQIRSRVAVPALISALSNERNHNDVRREAAIALGRIGDPSAVPALQAVLTSSDSYLAQAALDSLRWLNPQN